MAVSSLREWKNLCGEVGWEALANLSQFFDKFC